MIREHPPYCPLSTVIFSPANDKQALGLENCAWITMRYKELGWLVLLVFCWQCKTVPKPATPVVPAGIPYYPLRDASDLNVLLEAIGDKRIVLLGESTHGTHEFYQWRAVLTKRLIAEKGFSFVGLEGDWVDTYKVNRFVEGPAEDSLEAVRVLQDYDRWPAWMWGNHEFAELVRWINRYNQTAGHKAGIYGLDVYSFWEWIDTALSVPDTAVLAAAAAVKTCLQSFDYDALKYAGAVQMKRADCRSATEKLWQQVKHYLDRKKQRSAADFLLEQQALLALNGERYFRTMVRDRPASWNIRDGHMAQTVNRLLHELGRNSKAVIWAHNGHVGDAHYSEMSTAGYSSIGEMLRREWPGQTFSVGFGTYKGTVMAGYSWNGAAELVKVPPAKEGSWEDLLHDVGPENKIILSREIQNDPRFNRWLEFRAIGAVFGEWAVYGRSVIPKRFDAFIYVDSTSAVKPVR